MSTVEVAGALDFIKAKLASDGTLMAMLPGSIRLGMAPSGTTQPWIVLDLQANHDTLTMNAVRIISHLLFQVRVVGLAANAATLFQAAARADDLLKRTSGTSTGSNILGCYREESILFSELINGVQWQHCGGLYRSIVQQV
jgi:hypothetical protein